MACRLKGGRDGSGRSMRCRQHFRWAVALTFLLLLGGRAASQEACTSEIEPNDQIDQAASIAGAACFEGVIEPAKQDRFVWSIPEGEGAHGWELSFEGGYR